MACKNWSKNIYPTKIKKQIKNFPNLIVWAATLNRVAAKLGQQQQFYLKNPKNLLTNSAQKSWKGWKIKNHRRTDGRKQLKPKFAGSIKIFYFEVNHKLGHGYHVSTMQLGPTKWFLDNSDGKSVEILNALNKHCFPIQTSFHQEKN